MKDKKDLPEKILREKKIADLIYMAVFGIIEAFLIYLLIKSAQIPDVPREVKYLVVIFFVFSTAFVAGLTMAVRWMHGITEDIFIEAWNEAKEEEINE